MSTPFRKISPFITYTPKYIEIISDPNYSGADLKKFEWVKNDTVWTIAERNAREEPDLPFLGTRQYNAEKDIYTSYKFITYREGIELATHVASGFVELGLKKGDACTGCFVNRPEWIITDLALFRQGAISSPLRGGLNNNYYMNNIKATKPTFAVIAADKVKDFFNLCVTFNKNEIPITYKAVVVLPQPAGPLQGKEVITKEQVDAAASFGVRFMTWEELIELGKAHPHDAEEPDPCAGHSIIFTSGTTSNQPKGVVIPQRGLVSTICRHTQYEHPVFYSYINFAHISERSLSNDAIGTKGCIGFPSGPITTMLDDLEALRPTLFCAAPIVLKTLQAKASDLMHSGLKYDLVKAISRKKFGERCEYCVFFGAPCADELAHWVTDFLGLKFSSAYGLTESGGPVLMTPYSATPAPFGCIGQPGPLVTVRLIDAPELGYNISDETPCGELLIRNAGNMIEYLNDPEKTAAAVDDEGFLHTNDIVKLNDDGTLTIVDRRDNMFKTSGATYVPPEQVESIINTSQLVSQAFVYGRPSDNFIVAAVVPNFVALSVHPKLPAELREVALVATKNPLSRAASVICANKEANKIILEDILRLEKESHFPNFWYIEGIILDPIRWTEENGLLTFTNKLRRKGLSDKFRERLDELMDSLKDKVQFTYC